MNPVMDATRISDGKLVMLKRLYKSVHPFEIAISQFFTAEPQASDPKNHCVPILEVLQDPEAEDKALMVMPYFRKYDDPRFDTFGEAVECFRQLFEVFAYFALRCGSHLEVCWPS
jgi:serine/threonine protein kinase